jgi:hypothetical protein
MGFIQFLRSVPGRIARVVLGTALIAYGATHPSLYGLVLMMVGMVPAVTGVAGICLLDEVLKVRGSKTLAHRKPQHGRVYEN